MNTRLPLRLVFLAIPLVPLCAQDGMPGPGPEHKELQRFVGTWDVTVEQVMPDGQKMHMQAIDETSSICNGMWLLSKVTGQGMPFSGIAIVGWNPGERRYTGLWVDSMTAAASNSTGTFDKDASAFHMDGQMETPDGMIKTHSVTTFKSADAREEKIYTKGEGGKDTMIMHLVFQRRPADAKAQPAAAGKGAAEAMGESPKTAMHDKLAAYAGTWNAVMEMTMPGMPPMKSEMKQIDALVCDGLWLHTVATGPFMGMQFEGHGLMGYDPDAEEFVAYWVDTMAPAIMVSRGKCSDDGKVFTLRGTGESPMGPVNTTDETRFTDKDHRVMTMASKTKDGDADAGTMTLTYTRAH